MLTVSLAGRRSRVHQEGLGGVWQEGASQANVRKSVVCIPDILLGDARQEEQQCVCAKQQGGKVGGRNRAEVWNS